MKTGKIVLPSLRGKMGDWFYYVSIIQFKELAQRVSMTDEIHKNESLSRWIQREVSERSKDIIEYLEYQEQRFFNAIILGIYGGKPFWQEVNIEDKVQEENDISEKELDYLNKTFGILTLSGEEKMFAIDGQHRTKAIQEVLTKNKNLENEEVTVIFVAHKKTPEGEVRTRRLFSTLNRYAKPVTVSEIIALDEEDNCAILTRGLIENYPVFKDKILIGKTRSINPKNKTSFTNIVLLYEIITYMLTDKITIRGINNTGYDFKKFTTRREKEEVLKKELDFLKKLFSLIIKTIPSIKEFFSTGYIDRTKLSSSLLFKPIGQNIFFTVLKISSEYNKKRSALNYFRKDTFNLGNQIWKKIFYNKESRTIKTDKSLQKFAVHLILMHLKIFPKLSNKEKEIFDNFKIDPKRI